VTDSRNNIIKPEAAKATTTSDQQQEAEVVVIVVVTCNRGKKELTANKTHIHLNHYSRIGNMRH
jgi:hypothetical protein